MSDWHCELNEDGIYFQAPSGFIFFYKEDSKVIDTLSALYIKPSEFGFTWHNERFRIDGDNNVRVISCDPWINEGFRLDDPVADALEFVQVLLWYLAQELRKWKHR